MQCLHHHEFNLVGFPLCCTLTFFTIQFRNFLIVELHKSSIWFMNCHIDYSAFLLISLSVNSFLKPNTSLFLLFVWWISHSVTICWPSDQALIGACSDLRQLGSFVSLWYSFSVLMEKPHETTWVLVIIQPCRITYPLPLAFRMTHHIIILSLIQAINF